MRSFQQFCYHTIQTVINILSRELWVGSQPCNDRRGPVTESSVTGPSLRLVAMTRAVCQLATLCRKEVRDCTRGRMMSAILALRGHGVRHAVRKSQETAVGLLKRESHLESFNVQEQR
jgi:hypothetical protein